MIYESKQKKIAPKRIFICRVILNILIALFLISICLGVGMYGYHYFEKMEWIDAYVNASMILSGMGPVQELKTYNGKLFAGTYALFSGIVFLFFMAMIFAPILHRFYHQFHVKDDNSRKDD